MAWIYLAELLESVSHSKNTLEPLHIVSVTDTHKAFYCPECDQVTLIELQSGMMCNHSQKTICQESTSLQVDFPAKTSVLQELEQAWMESEVDYFSKFPDSLASYDQDSYSWKTYQLSLFGGLTEYVWSSLRWGMIVDGRLYQPLRWVPRTLESDGSYLPTPTAIDPNREYQYRPGTKTKVYSLSGIAKNNLWPSQIIKKMWLTPTATEIPNRSKESMKKRIEYRKSIGRTTTPPGNLAEQVGGNLNPQWVEWLMGYKTEWTELDALVTQWFQSKRKKRLKD